MNITKINGFFVPANDIHLDRWKAKEDFTQSKCLNKFLDYCKTQNKKFHTVMDIGAWCGTWSKAIESYAKRVVAFEPDPLHFHCLEKNCTINCIPRNQAVGSTDGFISLTEDDFTQAKRVAGEGKIPMVTIDGLEYDNIEGMVQLSDASTRRKRKSVCLLKVNKRYPLLVIRVDESKKYIDLSNVDRIAISYENCGESYVIKFIKYRLFGHKII